MFKLKNIFGLLVVLVLSILVYNLLLGTPEEKEDAKQTFQTIGKAFKEVGGVVGSLLKSEKEKFDGGKYDQAMEKIGSLMHNVADKMESVAENSGEYMDQLQAFNEKRKALQEKIDALKSTRMSEEQSIEKNEEMKEELRELNDLATELEKKMRESGQ